MKSKSRAHDETLAGRGVPLVYHGTPATFADFEIFSLGVHFSSQRSVAEEFAGVDGWVIAARLAIRRPLRLPDLGTWEVRDLVANALDRHGLTEEQAGALHDLISRCRYDDTDFHAFLAANGFDGLVYANRVEGGGDSYVAFHSRQIRVLGRLRGRSTGIHIAVSHAPCCLCVQYGGIARRRRPATI